MARPDPYQAFRFHLEIAGIDQGGFQTVSGLERQTTIEPYREGGLNTNEHQFALKTTYPPLTLKRGLVDAMLWDWHQDVIDGTVVPETITIFLIDGAGNDVWQWVCEDAFPAKWTGAELDATSSKIATESVEFVHHGLRRQ